jgi:hypothetical protein
MRLLRKRKQRCGGETGVRNQIREKLEMDVRRERIS